MRQGQDYGGTQDRGRRSYQEDAFHFQPLPGLDGTADSLLMAMADGMGGHHGGAQASAAAIEAFVEGYVAASEPEADRLQLALLAANQRIARDIDANPALRGMGCTLVGVSLTPAGLHLVSVGDSLAYLFRNGELTRLNADHSMAPVLQQAVVLGTLSQDEVACHPHRHALRSAVTGRELSLIDLRREPMELLPGDKVLVASDGLLTLPATRIAQLLGQYRDRTAEELSKILVEAVTHANKPHQDNVTVMVTTLPSAEAVAVEKGSRVAGWPLPVREATTAALRRLLQPRVLVMLSTAFLLAAVALGVITTWLHQPRPTVASDAAAPTVPVTVQGTDSEPPAPLAGSAQPEKTGAAQAGEATGDRKP